MNENEPTLADVWHRLHTIEKKVDDVLDKSGKVETIAQKVAEQVKPVLDDLMKSPILKMLGVNKK
jgi:hypothetical protein